ncbi:hypothetical protein HNQ92_005014 [Rhabdobacter roseus]|uniref:PKD domain-containing protein n=1 Tax=Rhabdobacter roseus TaxID=1655419 RepID=A0A840TZZ3_9BACT|nr:PKD domain-containing protein [Rhabdobacter roseus]MBB5286853.1 hypothetical protein [Rhabdobacter roseus]
MKRNVVLLFAFLIALASCKEKETPLPIPTPEFSLADEYYAIHEYIQIKEVSEADRYRWDFGNGVTSTERIPNEIRYDKPGVYTIKLTTYQAGKESTVEKLLKIGAYFVYEVQLLSYFENYALEGGDLAAPSEGAPNVYLEIAGYHPEDNLKTQAWYTSEVRNGVSRADLPLTWAVDRIPLGGSVYLPHTFYPFIHFYDHNSDKADRQIARNLVAGARINNHFDKAKKEGYYSVQRGNDDWGSHVRVKYRIEFP